MSDSIIHSGSVHDIECTIKCNWKMLTVGDFKHALDYELRHQKRTTVIRMLERAIRRKEKEGPSIHWYFLYWSDATKAVYQGDAYASNERNAREYFESHYAGDLLEIRRGKPFSDEEIASGLIDKIIDEELEKIGDDE